MTELHSQALPNKVDALLAQYTSGTLSPAMHAMMAGHLELSAQNRPFVAALEKLQGVQLMKDEASSIVGRDDKLAAIFSSAAEPASVAKSGDVLPVALRNLIGKDFEQIKWRSRLPGLREYLVADEAGGQAVLYWIKAGRKMPSHSHHGSEVTLVLKGAFHDITGAFHRGDIAVADSDVEHQPIVDAGGDCICFAVTDAPLKLTGPVGRIIDRLFGHRH